MTSAEKARQNGWGPGTRLTGIERPGGKPCTIEITAVGRSAVLAFCVNHGTREGSWDLNMREWLPASTQMGDRCGDA